MRQGIQYAAGKAPLDFIRIETAVEAPEAVIGTFPGRVAFDEDHTQRVASPIDGRAVRILVKLGDAVPAHRPLIELSSPNAGLLQAEAQKALSDLTIAQKATERVHRLQTEGAVSEKEVAQSEGELRKARSDQARAMAQLQALGISPGDPAVTVALRAQIPGVVVERNVLVGQEVRADQTTPLLTISSLDRVWVLADVYEQDLGLVEVGDPVVVHVAAYPGETFPGVVQHIGDVVDPGTRAVKIRCVLDNPSRRLKPEMFARVEIKNGGRRKFITVPTSAVLNEGDRSTVVLAGNDSSFQLRRVEVGPESDGRVRVLSGLAPGDRVVTTGAIFMRREIATQ